MTGTLTAENFADDPVITWKAIHSPVRSASVATAIVGDAKRQDEFTQLFADVASYRHLKQNWDFDGGRPANARTIGFVTLLLQRLQPHTEIPAPIVRPISTGAFVSWQAGDRELYFEVDSESVLAAERSRSKSVYSSEDRYFNSELAARLVLQFFDVAEGY
jgi:hypothetical protein